LKNSCDELQQQIDRMQILDAANKLRRTDKAVIERSNIFSVMILFSYV
jgi:hypothetical protein